MTISKASAVAVAIGASIAGVGPAAADSFFLEQGSISVAGQNLSITRLPITLADGSVAYRDVVIRFKYVNGTIAFEYGFPKVTASVLPAPGPFVAGTYKLQGASNLYTLRRSLFRAERPHALGPLRQRDIAFRRVLHGSSDGASLGDAH